MFVWSIVTAAASRHHDAELVDLDARGQPLLHDGLLIKPYDGKPATVGNGTMIALTVDSNAKVDAVYRKAMELGGKDEGPPGPRGTAGFYAAYFRDLDGNKLNCFCTA